MLLGRRGNLADGHHHVSLPKVDPAGPHLVTAPPAENVDALSEKKLSFLREVEGRAETRGRGSRHPPHSSLWSVNEAKFGSTGILSNLGKIFVLFEENEADITLPKELVESLLQTPEELVSDTVVEKREWQTDCYLDYRPKNTQPFLTGIPDAGDHALVSAALQTSLNHQKKRLAEKQQQQQQQQKEPAKRPHDAGQKASKRVRMSSETKNELRPKVTPERPHTARSNASIFSLKSDLSDEGRDSVITTDYDRLPAELQQPSILGYRRESTMPKMKRAEPKTRREKAQAQEEESKGLMRKAVRKYLAFRLRIASEVYVLSVPLVHKLNGLK